MAILPPWPNPLTMSALKGGGGMRHDSAALCNDGRIIYMWIDSPADGSEAANTFQCHYVSPADFAIANNAAATTGTGLKATLSSTSYVNPAATVWRNPDGSGGLYLFERNQSWNVGETQLTGRVRCWVSPSGNGESSPGVPDWTLRSTINTVTTVSPSFGDNWAGSGSMPVGQPYVVPGTGRWILPTQWHPSADTARAAVYISDDQGLNWTQKLNIGYYILGGIYGYGVHRNVVPYNGKIWWSSRGNVDPVVQAWSADNGTTWTTFNPAGVGSSQNVGFLNSDVGGIYRANTSGGSSSGSGSGNLQYLADPTASPATTLATVTAGTHAILQRIEGNDYFMSNGLLLLLPYLPPPPDTIIDSAIVDSNTNSATFMFSCSN